MSKVDFSKVLGMTMVTDREVGITYCLNATYSPVSCDESPTILVSSNYKEERRQHDVRIYEINPKKATCLEMFAMCAYAEDTGMVDKGSFGMFHDLKQYMQMACLVCDAPNVSGYEDFISLSIDWEEVLNCARRELTKLRDFAQYGKCIKYMDVLGYFYARYYGVKVKTPPKAEESRDDGKEALLLHRRDTAIGSYCIASKDFTLEEWRTFLEDFERVGDAVKALMRMQTSQ